MVCIAPSVSRRASVFRRSVLAVALGALLSVPGTATPAPSTPTGYVLSGLPLVPQTYNACGPASIAQVLGYFGVKVTQQQVSALTRKTPRSYMTAEALVRYAPIVGMNSRLYANGTLDIVRSAVQNRLPLIALQDVTWEGKVVPHWRVIAGYDDAARRVYLMDPLLGYVTISYAEFTRVWNVHRGQFAVIYPPAWHALVLQVVG
ncbi:peptidase C39 (plasmid) [Deinococcus ficus]|uniref:Peptidase C39 n=1 Tax=Deinococcus ficus TaxID=317577 RepID=A0A221T3K3_9DEIO|nr:peptidase C39 [Deinococcus ficus]